MNASYGDMQKHVRVPNCLHGLWDGAKTFRILAALRDNVGALFAAVKLDKLSSRVDNEGCEVVPHLGLLLGLLTLALSGKASMHTLELRKVLQR